MRPRGITPEPQRSKLLAVMKRVDKANAELRAEVRAAVREANAAGGSIRDIAGLAEVSTNTIQRWLREGTGE